MAVTAARGLPVTIFRPSIVYGPWSDQWTAALAERLRSGRWRRYARYGEGTCNLVYVDDLVAAALSSIHSDAAAGQAFNVGGGDLVTWNEYFDRFNRAMGLPPLEVRSAQRAKAKSIAAGAVRTTAQLLLRPPSHDRCGTSASAAVGRPRPCNGIKRWMNTNPSSTELERSVQPRRRFTTGRKPSDCSAIDLPSISIGACASAWTGCDTRGS